MNSFAAPVGGRPPFTATQWQELQHQALIWKYLINGVPVPAELIIPIRRSFEALPGRYYHPPLSYFSYYGKKPDPEPGRCRRTDGKKWRCSKDAYPGSKYCERHMHRGRNRSRKPVESQTISPSQTSSSTLTSLSPSGSNVSGSGVGSFRSMTLQSIAGQNNTQSSSVGGASSSQLPMETSSLGNSFFSEASGNARALGVDSSVDSSWHLISSQVSTFPMSKKQDLSIMQNPYAQLQSPQDLDQVTLLSRQQQQQQQQQQHSFFGSEFASSEPVKHETQFLRPFFDEWPKARDSWSDLEEDRSNRTSFSTTQLSISIPMASSDFSSTSSRSPNDD